MQDLIDKVVDQFLTHGLIGAVALVAIFTAWRLYKENTTIRKEQLEREISRTGAYYELARDLEKTIRSALDVLERTGQRSRRRSHED